MFGHEHTLAAWPKVARALQLRRALEAVPGCGLCRLGKRFLCRPHPTELRRVVECAIQHAFAQLVHAHGTDDRLHGPAAEVQQRSTSLLVILLLLSRRHGSALR